jgi:hypothetical protein
VLAVGDTAALPGLSSTGTSGARRSSFLSRVRGRPGRAERPREPSFCPPLVIHPGRDGVRPR